MMRPDRRRVLGLGLAGAGAASLGLGGFRLPGERKIDLWDTSRGGRLRGAVISQRRVYHDIDGPEFLGPGPVGSPISDHSLAGLASSGANLLVLSMPGPWAVAAPYAPEPAIMDHLDRLVRRCERAGLFVVIGFRSGPGRSAFTFHRDSAGSWFPADRVDEHLWRSREAADAWIGMWREVARRLRDRGNVAGYLLMVEPNANQVAPGPDGGDLEEWDPNRLADHVAGTPADWPALARRIATGVREEDMETPILVSPDGYANRRFAGLLDLDAVPGQVLALHDYSPRAYTHQRVENPVEYQPGDGAFEAPDRRYWMMGEFGVSRWAPGAGRYLAERIAALEAAGAGWSVFRWDTGWRLYENRENRFNPRYGSAPDAMLVDPGNALMQALEAGWQRNSLRPPGALRL